jgi:hypothetical protein
MHISSADYSKASDLGRESVNMLEGRSQCEGHSGWLRTCDQGHWLDLHERSQVVHLTVGRRHVGVMVGAIDAEAVEVDIVDTDSQ